MEETRKTERPRRGILSSIMPSGNGTRRGIGSFVVSVAAAALFSVSAAVVSVQVMSSDLNRAKDDISAIEAVLPGLDRQVTSIAAERRAESTRWHEIQNRLEKIERGQTAIFRSLPRAWRDAEDLE